MMTQGQAILAHLKAHGHITSYEAFELYGCTRLSARIFDFRKLGYNIMTSDTTTKNRYGNTVTYATYILVDSEPKTNAESSD